MMTVTWILITTIFIYLIKLINDYRNWVRHFYKYPSYTATFSDFLLIFKGPEALTKNITSRTFFRLAHRYAKGHDYIVLWIGFVPLPILLKAKLIEDTFKVHQTKTIFMSLAKPFITDGLFMMPGGSKWKKFRRISEMHLRTKMLQKFFPIMSNHSKSLVKSLHDLGEDTWTDLVEQVGLATFNSICECGIGVSTASPKLQTSAQTIFEISNQAPPLLVKRMFNPLFWPLPIWSSYAGYITEGKSGVFDKLFKYLSKREISRQMAFKQETIPSKISSWTAKDAESIKDTVNVDDDPNLLQSNHIQINFLSQLVNMFINQGVKLNDIPDDHDELITPNDLINEANNFILAGFDTTKSSLLWVLNCIASEPTIQKRVYDELIEIFGEPDGEWEFDLEKLNQLTFLDACLRETLRMFPAQQLLGRNSDSDKIVLDGVNCIPPTTEYIVSVYSVHYDETIYPNPDTFDPDRWLGERGTTIPSNHYIPFGVGPRACVGYRFAMYEMLIVTASIVKNFEIKTSHHYATLDWSFVLTCRPIEDVKFQLKPRKLTIDSQ